jgi:pimeloyl-ACP methyl ester carboxylesterase
MARPVDALRWCRRALAAGALACLTTGCAANLLGREIRVEERPYTFRGHALSYFAGTPVGREAAPLPLVVFLEGDGPECQRFDAGRWTRFVRRFTGDHVLVRPRTRLSTLCGEPGFREADFLHRVDDLGALLDALRAERPGRGVYLVGHSAGAHVAILHVARGAPDVRGVVDLGGGLAELSRVLPEIERERHRRGAIDAEEAARRLGVVDGVVGEVRANAASTAPFWGRTYRFWGQMFFSGVDRLWRQARLPILVVHGEEDVDSVPVGMVRAAREELARSGEGSVTFDVRAGLGHDVLRADVFRAVDAWIRGVEARR